jgi:hypothetical protein
MLTPELAGVPARTLGAPVGNLSGERDAFVAALDLIISGI